MNNTGVSISGDQIAGQAYVPHALALLRRLSQRISLGGLQFVAGHQRLTDYAYVYGVVHGNMQRAVIVVDEAPSPRLPGGAPGVIPLVPDFVSGITLDGLITDPPPPAGAVNPPRPFLRKFWPTPRCAAFFGLSPAVQPSTRLAVEPYVSFNTPDALGPPAGYIGPRLSQYVKCKPTMFSGRMRQLVQLLLGFGRQMGESIYDRTPPRLGTVRDRRRYQRSPTKYQLDVARDGLQIRYDWRWFRTHGVARGVDGKFWLVEIGNTRGALAMPLPLHAITTTPEFREKLEEMGDAAGLQAINTFGGFPTGEGVPAGDIEAWIRAGRVVRLSTTAQLQDFYGKSTFSSAMGWAFNARGDEARNLAWELDATGFVRAFHYAYSVNMGGTNIIAPAPNASRLRRAIRTKSQDPNYEANLFKTDRMEQDDIADMLSRYGDDVEGLYAALNTFVAPAAGSGSGHLWLASSGWLYKPGAPNQYEAKYPWPELGYLLSFDMRPALGHSPRFPKCDTDIHAFYVGDNLKTVRYFRDPRGTTAREVEDDSDGCELVGTFTRREEAGTLAMPPMVYSNDFDDRAELVGARNVRVKVSSDLGYAVVEVADDITFPPHGQVSRLKRFLQMTTIDTWSGEDLNSSMTVPFDDRCAYYYAVGRQFQSHTHSVFYSYATQGDPWICNTWRNFPGYTGDYGIDRWIRLDQHPDGCGPVEARTVRAPGAVYIGDGGCWDFADSGPWCFLCDNADSMTYSIPAPPLPAPTTVIEQRTSVRSAFLVNENGLTPLRTESRTFVGDFSGYPNPWFIPSPAEGGGTQSAFVTHNTFGSGDVMRFTPVPNESPRVVGSPQPPGFLESNPSFVGVVP